VRDKRVRRALRRFRKLDAQIEQKEQGARIRKFKSGALGNQTRSSVSIGGEVPNCRKAWPQGCKPERGGS
jgi:hypothetical protein